MISEGQYHNVCRPSETNLNTLPHSECALIPHICHFLHTHILSQENFTLGKCVNLRQNCKKLHFSEFFWNFFTLSQIFYTHGVRSVRDKYQVCKHRELPKHGIRFISERKSCHSTLQNCEQEFFRLFEKPLTTIQEERL